ncbi:MAG: imidazole glycerol phosphate synthase subunit HisH [Chitinophagaceae bacterium]|jgi:glutamine amidotransferase|nr:imidazole glycerol phosphate synthase subunit HisH [Chitinophagaceae bacterium]OQY95708.1 MAG: imidazole glycerol phosphate synthase subunit HisH [Sphingobacteriales bacterium UTBCD1]
MNSKVVIIDYQLGNLFSVKQACEYLGYDAIISSNPEELLAADYAILPGVGAFNDSMKNLESFGLVKAIHQYINSGKPFMGVCLGLQLLLTESEEFGSTKGLNIIPGIVKKFPPDINHEFKVPQIQWNQIFEPSDGKWQNTALCVCKPGDYMYFVHSFYAQPDSEDYVLAKTTYGGTSYCSSVQRANVFATQFHPEKSGLHGVEIYKQWFDQNKK